MNYTHSATAMNTARETLYEVARNKSTINYTQLCERIGEDYEPYQARLSDLLYTLSMEEYDQDRPLISSVVINNDTNMPGNGYFEMLNKLDIETDGREMEAWVEELNEVYAFQYRNV